MKTGSHFVIRFAVIVLAVLAAFVRLPAAWVERIYSRVVYARMQPVVTSISNQVPFALFDVLLIGAVLVVVVMVLGGLREAFRRRSLGPLAWTMFNLAVAASVVYLVFLGMWGLNYERRGLSERLVLDRAAVRPEALRRLGTDAVSQLNTLYGPAHDRGFAGWDQMTTTLAPAFRSNFARVLPGAHPVPGVPKRSLLTFYFERAGISGVTDPFVLEILVDRGLLPFERPFVTAHEWAHLAGYGDEAEANFLGWLTCLKGDPPAAYSGWLYLYSEILAALPAGDKAVLVRALAAGPRSDLQAVAERARRIAPAVQAFSWRVYDQYLKANRVNEGVASYSRVLVLVLGSRYENGWKPLFTDR